MSKEKNQDIDPTDLPHKDAFIKKEIYQHPQPADWGKPLKPKADSDDHDSAGAKEEDKTSKEEGLNEEKSKGGAGAFEGFEDGGTR